MTVLLFIPPDGSTDWRWAQALNGTIVHEGIGVPSIEDSVIAVAPADRVSLHWAALPSRSPAQATAAARILAAEASLSPLADLHVAVGEDGGADRPIAIVSVQAMQAWLGRLAEVGVDPAAIVPLPMLLPRPADGFIRADIAGQGVVRGPTSGFADEAVLTGLVTEGVVPEPLDRDALVDALVAAAAAPALDLRQGPFARRRRVALDWPLIRKLAVLAGIALALTLAIDLVRIVRLNAAADSADLAADDLARTALPRGATLVNADRQLDERLSALRGPGRGFSATAAAVYGAIRSQPGAEMTTMRFDPDGDLHVSVATTTEAGATDLKRAIEATGFTVGAGVFQAANGRVSGEMTVSPK